MRDGTPDASGIAYNGGTLTATNVEDAILELYGASSGFDPANATIVAKSGGDYTSLKDAIDAANLVATATTPHAVVVYPGTYTENPMTVNSYVQLFGIGVVNVEKTDENTTLFMLDTAARICGFKITGPTNAACIETVPTADSPCIQRCEFEVGSVGILNENSGTSITIKNSIFYDTLTTSLKVDGGKIRGINLIDRSTQGVESLGSTGWIDLSNINFDGNDLCIFANEGGRVTGQDIKLDSPIVGVRTGTTDPTNISIEITNYQIVGTTTLLDVHQQAAGAKLKLTGGFLERSKFSIVDWSTVNATFYDNVGGDESFKIAAELHVGTPEKPSESVFGEGDSYTIGMVVLTTDSTATSTTDGGNITDVSTDAASSSGSTFSFQGVGVNHTILIGSQRTSGGDFAKHWGIKVSQVLGTTMVSSTDKPFVFEYWNGTSWTAFNVHAQESNMFYSYANNVFLRSSSSEQIRYGVTTLTPSDWVKKTIDSKELFWVRIRIGTAVTVAPVFQQFKLHTSRFEINGNGTTEFFGNSRFRKTLSSTGNIFGESGGVGSGSVSVGTGVPPTGWSHQIKNSLFNGSGDAITFQFLLPKGVDTSLPLNFKVVYLATSTDTTATQLILSMLPLGVERNLAADTTAGAIVPIARPTGEDKNGSAAQTVTQTETMNSTTVLKQVVFEGYSVADYYGGDAIFVRFEGDVLGTADFFVISLEVSNVSVTNGDLV